MTDTETGSVFYEHRDRYIGLLEPLFLPSSPISNDIVCYFSSLLRVLGMEDKGWDPYAESRNILNDLNRLMKVRLPKQRFPDGEKTMWRIGLLLYSHIVEMDAPYEVLTNLLRFRLGKGYSPNPYFDLLTDKEKSAFRKSGIRTGRKIEIIKSLSIESGLKIGDLYDEFYNSRLRNAVQHSDFILAEDGFRSRSDLSGTRAFKLTFEELDNFVTKAKAFIAAYLQIEMTTRQVWGLHKGTAVPYDLQYKGLMEVLVDDRDLLCGFAIHWPNDSQSTYRRTERGVEMVNCMVDLQNANLSMMVGTLARRPGMFGPCVEDGHKPVYTPLDGSNIRPTWPADDRA
ncbi:hypothetical protein O7A70_01450 [Mesorhizobium sp. Cs1299R1N1]|uniref:hypothetical protein n=1 Tax=Mesorhizobium sp. Cs1299R1N1 TaxID=3015172 RepID=UPI00301B9FDF